MLEMGGLLPLEVVSESSTLELRFEDEDEKRCARLGFVMKGVRSLGLSCRALEP